MIGLTTDDPQEAFAYLTLKRLNGEIGWDMAEVRLMEDPPRTVHKWCVFRKETKDEKQDRAREDYSKGRD